MNALGEGPKSVISEGTFADLVPTQPAKPKAKKLPRNIVMINITPSKCTGSAVTGYHILCFKDVPPVVDVAVITKKPTKKTHISQNYLAEKAFLVVDVSPDDLSYSLSDLEGGYAYRFRVLAMNKAGSSEVSELSDSVHLDVMLPTPSAPAFDILTSTSVKIHLPDIHQFTEANTFRKIAGFHIQASFDPSMTNAFPVGTVTIPTAVPKKLKSKSKTSPNSSPHGSETAVNATLPGGISSVPPLSFIVQDLERGGNYYFAVQCFGPISGTESNMSPSVWVPLATNIPLPLSGSVEDNASASNTTYSSGYGRANVNKNRENREQREQREYREREIRDAQKEAREAAREAKEAKEAREPILPSLAVHRAGRARSIGDVNAGNTSTGISPTGTTNANLSGPPPMNLGAGDDVNRSRARLNNSTTASTRVSNTSLESDEGSRKLARSMTGGTKETTTGSNKDKSAPARKKPVGNTDKSKRPVKTVA